MDDDCESAIKFSTSPVTSSAVKSYRVMRLDRQVVQLIDITSIAQCDVTSSRDALVLACGATWTSAAEHAHTSVRCDVSDDALELFDCVVQ